jgi:hypothetical protein
MEPGAVALDGPWNPLLRLTVRGQRTLPGQAFRPHCCPTCATVVVPPDADGADR